MRLGLIGCGHQARNLGNALKGIDNLQIAGVSDIDEERAKSFIKDYSDLGIKFYDKDYRNMLLRKEIDGVVVVVPHNLLKEVTMESAAAGKHIFVEKPMSANIPEAREMIKAAKEHEVKLMVGYCMRYLGVRKMMKDLIVKGAIGRVNLVTAGKACAPLSGWLADSSHGGGVLLWIGVHLIDQVLWMVNDGAERVYAEVNHDSKQKIDEREIFTIRFKNGVLANLNLSAQPWYRVGTIGYDFVEALGSEGYIRADWPRNVLSIYSSKFSEYKNPTTIQIYEESSAMYRDELKEFAEAISNDREPGVTGQDGLKVLEITDAVLKSWKMSRTVELKST